MVEKEANYFFKMMSGDILSVSFNYLVKPNNRNFQASFVLECRRIFPYMIS